MHASAAARCRRAAHQRPICSIGRLGDRDRLRQPAFGDHRDAVAEREDLVQVLRDHDHRRAIVGQIDQRLVDRGRRAGIDAPGRLRRPPARFGLCFTSRPTMNFCRLPPDSERASAAGPVVRTSKLLITSPAKPAVLPALIRPLRDSACAHIAGQKGVLAQRHVAHRAVAVAFLRHEAAAERAPLARPEPAGRNAVDRDRIRPRRQHLAGQGRHQLACPLPAMPPMPRISPPLTAKLTLLEVGAELLLRLEAEIVHREARPAGGLRLRRVMAGGLQLGADHQLGQMLRGFLARIAMRDHLAQAHDGRALAQGADLFQLVADIEDGAAFRAPAGAASRTGAPPPAASAPRSARP